MKIYVLNQPARPQEITQKQKVIFWGKIAEKCLTKPYDTSEKFFSCLENEAEQHLN